MNSEIEYHLQHMLLFSFIKHIFAGMGSAFSLSHSPLYRYPYRNSGEAIRGDWLRIGEDVNNIFEQEHESDAAPK